MERLADYYGRSPDQLTEQELRDYFTYLVKKKQIAQSTLKTYIFAIKFLYTKSLQKPWPTRKLLRARKADERLLLYRTAIETGLRSNAVKWTRGRLYFNSEPPYITCKAGSTKNRKDARVFVRHTCGAWLAMTGAHPKVVHSAGRSA